METGGVMAVAMSGAHGFSKRLVPSIMLVRGLGVEGDAHQGVTVRHRSRVRVDPAQPNLRQVHLIQAELFDELQRKGFTVGPGELGENITTRGINLLDLPRGTVLAIGETARLEVTGLRNPCAQIEQFQAGLLAAVVDLGPEGAVIRKAGIMAIVLAGGGVRAGDPIAVEYPPLPHQPLERV